MRRLEYLSLCLPVLALALAPACRVDSGSNTQNQTGGLTLALTDAPADEIASFTVEVERFRLHKKSGAVTSVLATPVTIDLISLTDLSQVLNVLTVPVGLYASATVDFDFTGAMCVLNGQSTPATILDASGAPLTGTLSVPIQFGNGGLRAVSGKHKLLELDFDLEQSLVVNTGANTVAIEPVLVMRVDPLAPKQLMAFGELVTVNQAGATFTANVKVLAGPTIGTVQFIGGPTTVFQIDGVSSVGATGLTALAAQGAGTWTQVYGFIDPLQARIHAVFVAAGTGTYNGGSDIVEGHVLARSSGAGTSATLTVRGHSNNATHTQFQFNTSFSVSTSFADTKIVKPGSLQGMTVDDVNVGQRVRIFGTLAGTNMDASSPTDVIRLQPTRTYGFANGAPVSGTLSMDLSRVDLLAESLFTWADSGANPPIPTAFTVDTAGLAGGLGITSGMAVEARGFFAPVDDPDEDQAAISLTNLENAPSILFVRDVPSSGHAMAVTASSTQIQLSITGAPAVYEAALVGKAFVGTQTLPTTPAPTIEAATGFTLYLISDKVLNSTSLYLNFDEFSNALALALSQGASATQIAAIGPYDAPTNTLQAALAGVCLQ